MNRKQYKGRVEKCTLPKFTEVCRLYSLLHKAYATKLSKDPFIKEARCNVELERLNSEHPYTSDFFCWKADESCMVREVTTRKSLSWPATINNLALSQEYWAKKGIALLSHAMKAGCPSGFRKTPLKISRKARWNFHAGI